MLNWKRQITPYWFGSFRREVKSAFKAKSAKRQRIFTYVPTDCRKDPEGKAYTQTIAQVKSILKDETYIENSVHCQGANIFCKDKKRIRKDPSERVCVEGTHEVIILKDVFDHVQKQIATHCRSMKDQTIQIFFRSLECAGCGWPMRFRTKRQIKKPYRHYDYSRYGQPGNQCSAHYVRCDILYSYVLSCLQFQIKVVHQDEKAIATCLLKFSDSGQEAKHRQAVADKKRAGKCLTELDSLVARIYEDRTAEVMTARDFSILSQKFQQEQKALETRILASNMQLEAVREQTETLKNGLLRQSNVPACLS